MELHLIKLNALPLNQAHDSGTAIWVVGIKWQ